jgi:hypothetical protein
MGGLALGNYLADRHGPRLARPILAYGCLELTIAATGTVLTWALAHLPTTLAPFLRALNIRCAPTAMSTATPVVCS